MANSSSFWPLDRCVYCGHRIWRKPVRPINPKFLNAHTRCWLNDDENGTL